MVLFCSQYASDSGEVLQKVNSLWGAEVSGMAWITMPGIEKGPKNRSLRTSVSIPGLGELHAFSEPHFLHL